MNVFWAVVTVADLSEKGSRTADGDGGNALDAVLSSFAYAVGADTGQVMGTDAGYTGVLAAWALDGHEQVEPRVSGDLLGRALAAGAATVDVEDDGREPQRVTAVTAPIVSAGATLGAIYAGFVGAPGLAADELRWIADSYARVAAMCMTSDVGVAAVLGASAVDSLTGCLSGSGTVARVRDEVERSQRGGHRLSCCFFDLDGFRRLNDDRGRLEGNRVLAAVGSALRGELRGYDAVGRLDGDVFVAILPETGVEEARLAAARAAGAASSGVRETAGEPVDVSVGVAEWDSYEAGEDLLDRAERAMRSAKASGGARVVADGPPGQRLDGLSELSTLLANVLDVDRPREEGV